MTQHVPVMLAEVLEWLDPQPGQVVLDGTLGGGGHTRALAERVGERGCVVALDRDPAAVEAARVTCAGLPVRAFVANYRDMREVLSELEIEHVDAVLLDLGLSSDQLADRERGFSFDAEGPLDLRFDPTQGEPAYRLIDRMAATQLAEGRPVRTARELAEVVRRAIPRRGRGQRIDPATRTFQALRIAVNDELGALEQALRDAPDCLRAGGRMAVISFHSLEDRRVKEAFRDDPRWKPLTRKPQQPGEEELARNPRSRSAKMRVAERVV
jgi:16S rRNA (cytosine1402-N4)-methyltransferase